MKAFTRHAMRPAAILFDLDGTLVDNMRFHGDAWLAAAARIGATATREDFEQRWAGQKSSEIFSSLLGRPVLPDEAARLSAEKESDYRNRYGPHLAPLSGLVAFLRRLREAGIRPAVATAAPEENRRLVLDGLGIRGCFEAVVGPEGAVRGKPAPDIYLSAARALAVEPDQCLAFEDAINGIAAARAAGMLVVGVATGVSEPELRAAGASFTIRDFESLPPELEALLFS